MVMEIALQLKQQRVALQQQTRQALQCVAGVLQYVAVCCSVLQGVAAVCCSVLQYV